MACNCSKCNSNKPCGCADSALHTPCTYTNCGVGSERCEDIQPAECVSYTGTSFQLERAGYIFKIETGERLDLILQKLALTFINGFGPCNADNMHHAPYNFYAGAITNTTIDLIWNGESSLTTGISIYYIPYNNEGVSTFISLPEPSWVLANSTPIAPNVNVYPLTGLAPNTSYKIKLVASDGNSTCESVVLLITTLP